MKVAMLVLNTLTHDARVRKEAATLARAGYDVTVLAYQDGMLPAVEETDGFHIQRIALWSDEQRHPGIRQPLRYLEFTVRAAHLLAAMDPDVCHAHAVQALPACWLASRVKRCHLIYDAHEYERGRDFSSARNIPALMKLAWSLPESLFIRKGKVITVSDSLATALAETYQIPRPLVLRNVPESCTQTPESDWLSKNYDLSDGSPIVLYQGKLSQGRGLENLLRSAQFLPGVVIAIVGDGPLEDELRSLSRELLHPAQVVFAGRVPLSLLPQVTQSAQVGAVLTQNTCLNHYYSLPNKLFEYVHAGIPVVGSDLPEIADIIDKYEIGKVVDPESPQSIASGIRSLVHDPDRYQRAKCRTKHMVDDYNWRIESQKLLTFYRRLGDT